MITKIQNNNTSFKGSIPKLNTKEKILDKFLQSQENLSHTRFIQGTLTNWFPKAVLSRSFIDFSEFTFLEFIESGIFYFAAPLLGEHIYKKGLFKKIQPQKLKNTIVENLPKSVKEIRTSKLNKIEKNKLIVTKAGILLGCIVVPAMEYALGFAKNLFTLKVFKVSNFNNVANLNKEKKEDKEHQKKVEKHSKQVLLKTGLLSLGGLIAGIGLSIWGHKNNIALKFAKIILEPGEQISKLLHKSGINSNRTDKFLKEYLKLDFDNNNGKLALSKGQLAITCITGLFGYSQAAKDRGKLDFYEVWTRVPLVVLYTIFGSALLDGKFKKYLADNNKFPELIKRNQQGEILEVPKRTELEKIAQKLAKNNNTKIEEELSKLIKQKSVITGVPYLFSLLAMGFTLSGISRLWTQYRYNRQQKYNSQVQNNEYSKEFVKFSNAFSGIHK